MAKPYGLVKQKLCYIQMLLNAEKSGEQDQECSKDWLVSTDPENKVKNKEHIGSCTSNIIFSL